MAHQSALLMRLSLALIVIVSLLASAVSAYATFSQGERVILYANRIGPYANPSVFYKYYSLPFCPPDTHEIKHKDQHLGEKLEGDLKVESKHEILFNVPVTKKVLCKVSWGEKEIKLMQQALKENYYFEFVLDDLPVGGFIGAYHEDTKTYMLFKHQEINIVHNPRAVKDKAVIIHANITHDAESAIELPEGLTSIDFAFTYSVKWEATNADPSERHFYGNSFFDNIHVELEIHWLSIINSFVLVILLTGFLAIILLRILRSDFARYARDEEDEADTDDYGWKLVHGDVFRFPPHRSLFSAFVGVGAQFLAMMVFILLLAIVGLYYPGNDGALYVSALVLYALTAGVAGFTSNYLYKQMGGTSWAWNTVLVATVFALPFLLIAFVMNVFAVSFQTLNAIPFEAVLAVIAIWIFIGFPLTLLGGITGKRLAGNFEAPVRTKNFAREIPPTPWFRRLPVQMMIAGFLPFSAIYIELFYIFNSVWARGSYQLFGILTLVFIILLIVTACITIAVTYFQLAMEDWRWWWHSFLSGGATGIFIYGYSIFYFLFRSQMNGFLQAVFYFGYMTVVSYFFFLMLGTVGFYASLFFVRAIYRNLHTD